jgi:octaprenyl-diphosphate synthase
MISKIKDTIKKKKIESVLNDVKSLIKDYVVELEYKELEQLLSKLATGKMLRTKLILKIAGVNDDSKKLSAIIEMIHAASLLHDDVLDNAMTRRGEASINAIYGDHTAIMFGDILYSKAFVILSTMDPRIAQTVSNAVVQLSIGEMMDVNMAKEFNTNKDTYFDMIYKKTSALIEASSVCAAILANKDIEKFRIYGRNLGVSFQIVDDILDITSSDEVLGKPSMSDLREGKVTLPYILLYEKLEEDDREYLLSLHKKELYKDEKDWLINRFNFTNAIKETTKTVNQLCQESIESIKDENLPELEEIMVSMTQREF